MYQAQIKEQIQKLILRAKETFNTNYVAIIASTQDHSGSWADYDQHSVKTSYLARHELEEIIASFRKYCIYVEVYTDVEDFLKAYYTAAMAVQPTMIFETSSKGIGRGRDALIPTLCDLLHYPHLGSDATSCILCSSKYQWASILQGNGLPVPKSYLFSHNHWQTEPPMGEKYILKLNNECASIGLSASNVMIYNGKNLTEKAQQLHKDYGQQIIAQEFVSGYEVEVPVLINQHFQLALPPIGLSADGEIYHKDRFFDYDTIFADDYVLYDFSAIMPAVAAKLQQTAYQIIDLMDLSGYMRIDFRVRADGKYYVIDINNDPCINSCGSFRKSLELLDIDPQDIAGVLIGNRML